LSAANSSFFYRTFGSAKRGNRYRRVCPSVCLSRCDYITQAPVTMQPDAYRIVLSRNRWHLRNSAKYLGIIIVVQPVYEQYCALQTSRESVLYEYVITATVAFERDGTSMRRCR